MKNYNINFKLDDKGLYVRPKKLKYDIKDKNGNIIYDSNNEPVKGNISGTVEKINGENTKSLIQRLKNKIFNKGKGEEK